jgi:hypothetical protein
MARRKRSAPRKRTQTKRTQPQPSAADNKLDIFRQVTADTFVIAALVPEAAHNERLFRRGAKNAQERLSQVEVD